MEVQGYITDSAMRRIRGTVGILAADGKTVLAYDDTADDGSFLFYPQPGNYMYFAAPGYVTKIMRAEDIGGGIVLNKPVNIGVYAIVIPIAYALFFEKRKKGIGKLNFDAGDVKTIMLIVGGVVGFDLIVKILQGLGFWKDANERALDQAGSNPDSFWNPNYWKKSQNYSYAIDTATAKNFAKQIHDAFGLWNDDEAAIINVFHQLRTKANISFLAYVYAQEYGTDLFEALRSGGGLSMEGLSDAELSALNNFGNSLPAF